MAGTIYAQIQEKPLQLLRVEDKVSLSFVGDSHNGKTQFVNCYKPFDFGEYYISDTLLFS